MRSVEHLVWLLAKSCGHRVKDINQWLDLHGCKMELVEEKHKIKKPTIQSGAACDLWFEVLQL